MRSTEDQQLARQAQGGDQQALAMLVERNREAVFGMTLRILGNREDALDACQEALLRLIRYLRSYRPESPFAPWIRSVAVRAALDQAKKSKRHWAQERDPDTLASRGPDPHHETLRAEQRQLVQAALDTLTAAQRAAFVCKELEGMDTRDIAKSMACRQATVRWHLFEARRRLADSLGEKS